MTICKATLKDLNDIIEIINHAKKTMYTSGNTTQWSKNYPAKQTIVEDIKNGYCYICLHKEEAVATFTFVAGPDQTYHKIYNGEWLNNYNYYVIHRIASNNKIKGVGRKIINWCLEQNKNIRIDTHENNTVMQHLLIKSGFKYCGTIITDNGTERLAYHKD